MLMSPGILQHAITLALMHATDGCILHEYIHAHATVACAQTTVPMTAAYTDATENTDAVSHPDAA
jgi:hypothetical protein